MFPSPHHLKGGGGLGGVLLGTCSLLSFSQEEEIADLRAKLDREAQRSRALMKQVEDLKGQTEMDRIVIESLRLKLESGVAEASCQAEAKQLQSKTTTSEFITLEAPAKEQQLTRAINDGNIEGLKELLDDESFLGANARSGEMRESALHVAARCGHYGVAKTLLESPRFKAANVQDCEGNTALHVACSHGSVDVTHLLLSSNRFQPVSLQNTWGRTALHSAAVHGHDRMVKMLLVSSRFSDNAVNTVAQEVVDQTAEKDMTALHLAAKFGHAALAQILLETPRFQAADAATSELQESALHVAARYGHCSVVEALLENKGSFNAVHALEWHGSSALHMAALHGQTKIAEMLLRSPRFQLESLQNKTDEFTALHDAALRGHEEVARLLLSDGERFPTSAVNLVALYRAIRLRFGYVFESCDANGPRSVKNTNPAKQRPDFSPILPVGSQESVFQVPRRGQFHAAIFM